ncbi:zinc ribbon domain-containing protein YjdM [Neisseria sp. Ec49-e6-T10]|uniref:zinc ribbon domain-containing protein YjdM n=1 Tax=Neisseria sp. Ec49-e6-T10 TaxID=3140744 RepID=UPI003EB77CCF
MDHIPTCPVCGMENTYPDGSQYICPDCTHEWSANDEAILEGETEKTVKDANGNVLVNGDSVILVKDLKVKGSSLVLKKGTKVKGIRIIEGDHDIDCKVDGISLQLKSEFLKKA